jgi:hypothetical protein
MVGIGDRTAVSGLVIDFCALPCSQRADSYVDFGRIVADNDTVGGDYNVRLSATVVLVLDRLNSPWFR